MNITCNQCLKPFSISADQLGTRGKCPHCRATIILPKSARSGLVYDSEQLTPPNYWTQSLLCGLVTCLFHVSVLALIALLPWGDFSEQNTGDGTLVMIGKLPKNVMLENDQEELNTDELLNPENDLSIDDFETEMFAPTLTGKLSPDAFQDLSYAPSSGGNKNFQFESLHDSTALAGGSEDFSMLVSRLRKDGLDIVITFDSTGSMQGEIDQVKSQIHKIGSALFTLIDKTRIGICIYRDYGDSYVVDGLPLTDNLAEIVLYLEKVSAGGGGDEPEAVEEGIRWASSQDFRRSARKVILLFGDAPPRPSKSVSCQKMASDFRKQGGVISTVTCRKSVRLKDFIQIAQSGNGEAFLTDRVHEIMTQLVVLVFGSQHRAKVIEAFNLLENDN